MDEKKIQQEAKEIMDNFMNALSKMDVEEEFILNRKETFRKEGEPNSLDESYKNRFLSNAPKTSGDTIIANKG